MDGKSPAFRRSADTEELIRFLRSKPVGEIVSHEKLSEVTHRLAGNGAHVVASALKTLWRERAFWRPIRGVGIKRVSNEEAVGVADEAGQRIGRKARKTIGQLAVIDMTALDAKQKAVLNAAVTKMGLHKKIESPKVGERLLETCIALQKKLDMKPATMLLLE